MNLTVGDIGEMGWVRLFKEFELCKIANHACTFDIVDKALLSFGRTSAGIVWCFWVSGDNIETTYLASYLVVDYCYYGVSNCETCSKFIYLPIRESSYPWHSI